MSLIAELIFFAISEDTPAFRVAFWRERPPAAASTSSKSTDFSETLRRTSFSSRTVLSAASRSSLALSIVITESLSLSSIDELVFLKSNRLAISRPAWSTALRTSCMSISDTTSKLGMETR